MHWQPLADHHERGQRSHGSVERGERRIA
jgi:hypothetical protein